MTPDWDFSPEVYEHRREIRARHAAHKRRHTRNDWIIGLTIICVGWGACALAALVAC